MKMVTDGDEGRGSGGGGYSEGGHLLGRLLTYIY